MALLAPGCFSERMFLYCRYLEDIILMMGLLPFYHKLINSCSRKDVLFLAFCYSWKYLKSLLHGYVSFLTWLSMDGGMSFKIPIACKAFGKRELLSLALNTGVVLTKMQWVRQCWYQRKSKAEDGCVGYRGTDAEK